MAGDHRCPVCQSTFTRPQHVARHMRSHTGDRPYKCQICGDQFARSDLLSRHVNKCHAADKPANTTSRRRGSSNQGAAAAARATVQAATVAVTPEQAPVLSQCDQCKHAGLACDLRSQCTTCHQRRISCTYPRVRSSARKPDAAFASSAVYPPANNMSVPSLLPSSTPPMFPESGVQSYGSTSYYVHPLSNSADATRSPSSLGLHANQNTSGSLPEHNLLNMFPQYASGPSPPHIPATQAGDGSMPLLLPPGSAPSTQTTFGNWSAGHAQGMSNDFQHMGHNMNQARPSSLATDFMFELPDSRPSTGASLPSPRSLIDMSQPPVDMYGYRRGDHSQSGTESDFSTSSSPAVGRASFSAGSNPMLQTNNDMFAHQSQAADNSHPFAFDVSQQQPGVRNEVVSSAFGLLSLEEAMRNGNAVGAASASSPAQFSFQPPPLPGQQQQQVQDMGPWSRPGSQAGRPGTSGSNASGSGDISSQSPSHYGLSVMQNQSMGDYPGGLPAVSPGTEAREMREFWKNFMVDPYATGDTPHSETPGAARTPHGGRPGFMRGLSKSSSLPPLRRQSFNSNGLQERHAYDDSTPHASMAQQLGHAFNMAAPPKGLVNASDLRSYEEAIRARPPTVLKFDPRMRATPAGDLSGGEQNAESDLSRRGSVAVMGESPIPSIRRIAPAPGTSSSNAYSSSDDGNSRPSFKRLASQTLGPMYSKKAAHQRLGGDGDSPSASSASDAQGDDDSDSSGNDGAASAPRRHRGMRASRRVSTTLNANNMTFGADTRMSIPVTGA